MRQAASDELNDLLTTVACAQDEARAVARRVNTAPPPSAAAAAAPAARSPVVPEPSPDGRYSLAMPALGVGQLRIPEAEALRMILAAVGECLGGCRHPKLRLILVAPAGEAGDAVASALTRERARSARHSRPSLLLRFERGCLRRVLTWVAWR